MKKREFHPLFLPWLLMAGRDRLRASLVDLCGLEGGRAAKHFGL